MEQVTVDDIKKIIIPASDSHKGQNGRLLLIGGSTLFHAASLWSLTVASRIVDLVHYASVPENNEIVNHAKAEFRNGIVIERTDIERYIEEDDVILIGPGMMRSENTMIQDTRSKIHELSELDSIKEEGVQTGILVNYLLTKYPEKQWVIDAGALQMMDVRLIPPHAILTPHHGEFQDLWKRICDIRLTIQEQKNLQIQDSWNMDPKTLDDQIKIVATTFQCIVLHKGVEDIVCNGETGEMRRICGGNAGMTKGGTGDVLAGLIAALACKNDPFVSTIAGSLINKKSGDSLYETVGPFFNATDLSGEIPKTMKQMLG